jgi:Methyltransferase domain
MKLNLGCGLNKLPGYVNVDKAGDPDVRHDLERFPWPWADNVFEEVYANHVLEHLGRDADVFIGVMKELYRVCRPGATVRIIVPHPRNDDFLSDPTHVRPITPLMMQLFSRRLNVEWQARNAANSPLALYHGVDFELRTVKYVLEEPYRSELDSGRLTQQELARITREYNNVVREIRLTLEVVKA